MNNVLLSVLVPSVFDRYTSAKPLVDELAYQASTQGGAVEVLWLFDNRLRKLGKKREALIAAANGRYLCHIDDDDFVAKDFCLQVVATIKANPDADVVSYDGEATLDGENPFRVRTGLDYENEGARKDEHGQWQDIKRKPWQWCTWRTELARQAKCQDGNVDEDWFWLQQVIPLVKKEVHLDQVLHYYRFNSKTTLCQS